MSRLPTRDLVLDAARACLAAQGLRATTVDDVALGAGVSRATLYRAFPGGRDTILAALVSVELDALLAVVGEAIAAEGELRAALAAGLCAAARWLTEHDVVERLMFEEPATLLTHLEFEQMDRTLAVGVARVAPLLAPHLQGEAADRMAEWGLRLLVSYLLFPADDFELTSPEGALALVDRHVLPGVRQLSRHETISTDLSQSCQTVAE